MTEHARWFLQDDDLKDLTPQKARDLIVKCFFKSQEETFKLAKQKFNRTYSEIETLQRITAVIRLTFQQIDADFDQPTKDSLLKVVERLAIMAASWGTPEDVIAHHRKQLERVLGELK